MHKYLSYIDIGVLLIFASATADFTPSSDEELLVMKRKWNECCKNNICIANSCYIALRRASSWAAVRQRCQGRYPDWPFSVDIFQFRHEEELQVFSQIIQQAYNSTPEQEFTIEKVWTSGMRCPMSAPKGSPNHFTRWTRTNEPFPGWLEEKINYSDEEKDGCKFLVFSPSTNLSEMEYELQDQSSSYPGICEFTLPEDVLITTPSEESTYQSSTTTTEISTIPTIKSKTLGPSKEFQTNSTETGPISASTTIRRTTTAITTTTAKTTVSSTTTEKTNTSRFCKGKRAAGIEWPDTMPGTTVNKSCPHGMIGYAQWTCDNSTLQFTPAKPHIQDCKHIWIKELEDNVENGNDALDISSKLATETKHKEMSHGDITALVDLSIKIVHLFSMQKENRPKEKPYRFTGSMVSSMSNILRAEIKEAWQGLPTSHQVRAASKILQIVTLIGSHLSCIKKSEDQLQYTVSAENIGLETFLLNSEKEDKHDEIVFPQKVEGANSSLIVPTSLKWPTSTCKNYNTAVGVLYTHVGDFLKDESVSSGNMEVVTKVISFSMNNNTEAVMLPEGKSVTIILRHNFQGDFQLLRCMFWNFSKQTYGQWDASGCYRVSCNKTHVICSCNHLTNFAVLMDVNNNVKEDKILSMMTYVCCGMSSFSLVITLICFLSIRSLHGRRSIITGNLCFSLLLTNLLILFGLDQTKNKIVCATIAGFLHFWTLAAFCWMLVEGYHLYKMVVLVFERGHVLSVKAYYLFAYGVPLIVVSISAGMRTDDYGGDTYCWLSSNNGLMWSFVGPACAIILVNIVVFIMTLQSASSVRIKREQTTLKKIKNWARGSMSVMCLLGLTWCLGLFYIDKKLKGFSYIFTVLNGLQGVFIFFFHILLNDKVTSLFCCRGNKNERWRKCLQQTSSNHLHSKLSTRTSVNSLGCVSCSVPVLHPRRLSNITTHHNSHKESENMSRAKLRSRKKWSNENSKTSCKKEKATHTVSANGLSNMPQTRPFKTRSQSFPEDRENANFYQNISYINTNYKKNSNVGKP